MDYKLLAKWDAHPSIGPTSEGTAGSIGKWSLLAMYDLISRYIGAQMIPFDKNQHADLVFRLLCIYILDLIGGFTPPEKY